MAPRSPSPSSTASPGPAPRGWHPPCTPTASSSAAAAAWAAWTSVSRPLAASSRRVGGQRRSPSPTCSGPSAPRRRPGTRWTSCSGGCLNLTAHPMFSPTPFFSRGSAMRRRVRRL
uniref:Uncharacterized protein n=1 Tax=Arundo donax TaxID=35708 RepID=A0A0A9HM07_ARUDO